MRAHGYERRRRGLAWRAAAAGTVFLAVAWLLSRAPAIDGIPAFGYASGLAVIFGGSLFAPAAVTALARVAARMSARRPTLALAAANLAGAPIRSSVAVASLMIAIGMMVAVAVLVASFRTTVVAWAGDTLRADLFVRPLGLADASADARFSPGVAEKVRAVPGVASVDTFRAIDLPFEGRITSLGATDLSRLGTHRQVRLLGGGDPAALARTLTGSHAVLVSEPFATKFGVNAGDRVELPTPSGRTAFTVAAVYSDYSSDAGVVLLDVRTFRRLFRDDSVNSIAIYAAPGADLPRLRTAVVRALAPLRVDVETNRELRDVVVRIFDRTFAITYALDVIAVTIAVLGIVSTLFALVLERRREFGIMRYLGVTTGGVRAMVLVEAAGIGVAGRRARRRRRLPARALADLRHQPPSLRVAHRAARAVGVSRGDGRARRCGGRARGVLSGARRRSNPHRGRGAHGMMRLGARFAVAACAAVALGSAWAGGAATAAREPPARTALGFANARVPWRFAFPRDHAAHFAFASEWWYYTGHLTASDGRRFGYELTFFRLGLRPGDVRPRPGQSRWRGNQVFPAHFAVTDEAGQRFVYEGRFAREALGMGHASDRALDVAAGDWTLQGSSPFRMRASSGDAVLDLSQTAEKPPAVHGRDGVSLKAACDTCASHYYSMTRLRTSGTLTYGGRALAVRGLSWMDHEFGSDELQRDQQGWDWFSIQLDDRREVMDYRLRPQGRHAHARIERFPRRCARLGARAAARRRRRGGNGDVDQPAHGRCLPERLARARAVGGARPHAHADGSRSRAGEHCGRRVVLGRRGRRHRHGIRQARRRRLRRADRLRRRRVVVTPGSRARPVRLRGSPGRPRARRLRCRP